MLLLANNEAWPGFPTSVQMLRDGANSLEAMVAGIGKVEAEVKVQCYAVHMMEAMRRLRAGFERIED